ncbi:MAG TPA: hypothetical protein VIG06_17660 [Kofleriaceae bacterium]
MLQLEVRYERIDDFLTDAREQLAHGGLLVRGEPPAGADRGAAVELTVVTPVGSKAVTGQVLQVLAGAGVAVGFDAAELAELVARAEAGGAPAVSQQQAHGAAQAAKIQQALHGDKNQRAAILRENNKLLHSYVLRNPQLGLDEVAAIARMTTVAMDVLTFIAGRREWCERQEVAIALVRNPKTPVPLAIRMLDHVGQAELRQLAKQAGVREAISRVARKKILG